MLRRLPAALVDPLVGAIRRGPRTVLWTPENVFLGNFLYHWLVSHAAQARGDDVVARWTTAMDPWLDLLPRGREHLVISPSQVRFRDRRRVGFFQEFGAEYTAAELAAFVDDVIVGSPLLSRERSATLGTADVVVNVRRGDFYSDPVFRERFGFDVPSYLAKALRTSADLGGAVRRLHVVSDDVPWCRQTFAQLDVHGAEVTFAPGAGPADDFAVLATAPRIVATNSTFGYWAAHVSNRLHPGNEGNVVVPSFHDRWVLGGNAYQLNPAWTVIGVEA